jgi:CRISPR system Cascade subunit CasB
MRQRRLRLNSRQQKWVRDWWRALQPREEGEPQLPGELWALGRGARAELRRCSNVGELLSQATALLLAEGLIKRNDGDQIVPNEAYSYERLAWIAGVLATVKKDLNDGKSLAWHLGYGADKKTNERPKMSELRFKAMQRSPSVIELFRHWRRAVQLADGQVDVALLADDLLNWQIELGQSAARASDGVKFHWAYDYYLSARDRAAAEKTPESNQEISV